MPLTPGSPWLLIGAGLFFGGCVGAVSSQTGPDGGNVPPDAGATDSGTRTDAGVDAGVADAGPPDSGTSDAGSCVGALICDDFEAYPLNGPPKGPWVLSTNGGSVVIDAVHAHSGTHAVHVSTASGGAAYQQAYFGVVGAPVFPVAGNVVFGRMMIWLTAAPTQTTHWTNIQGEGPVTGQSYSAVTRYGGQNTPNLMANYDTQGVASDCWQHSTTAIPVQRWACMEWRFDGPNNEMDFWLDGTSITDLTVLGQGMGCINNGTGGKWNLPAYNVMRLGWEHYQTSDPIDLWIDDVALDVRRIGCPP